MVRETTLFSPWFSTGSGFEAFHQIHNNTEQPVTVTLRGYNSAGVLAGTEVTFVVPPNATVFKTAGGDQATGAANGGTVLTHNGAVGAISGNTTTLSGGSGLSFDSPFTPRAHAVLGPPVR